MPSWNIKHENVNNFFIEHNLQFDLGRQSEDMNLKLIKEVQLKAWPRDIHLASLGNFFAINDEVAIAGLALNSLLMAKHLTRQFSEGWVIYDVEKDVLSILTLVHFQLSLSVLDTFVICAQVFYFKPLVIDFLS